MALLLVLDFYSQPLKRVPLVLCYAGGLYGPRGLLSNFEGKGWGSPKSIQGHVHVIDVK